MLVTRYVFSVYLPYHQLRGASDDDFFEDTDVVRLILARIASYFLSLLDTGKFNRMACSILSPVGALSCKPTLAPVC